MLPSQQLVGLVVTAMSAAPALADGGAIRYRERPMPEAATKLIQIRVDLAGRDEPYTGSETPVEWDMVLIIGCTARATGLQTADEAAGLLAEAALARLLAPSTLPAGWEIDRRRLELRPDREELDERIGAVSIACTVRCMAHPTTHVVAP